VAARLVAAGLAVILEAIKLDIGYRKKKIGRDIDLDIREGEVLCLLGPNGGGKTTLMKTLLGLLPALGGSVKLQGRDIATFSRNELAKLVGYVPQAGTNFFPFTVLDVVLMGRVSHIGLFASPGKKDVAAADAGLASLGISHLRERIYTEISGGERQMVLIARALAQEPRLLVMDEPTASLDFGNQLRVLDQIAALAKRGMAVVLSTHDPDHVFLCGDRAALLRDGRLAALGPPSEVITPAALAGLYGVEVEVVELPDHQTHTAVPARGRKPFAG
jgi:iron complex transport system ATP-binding protein